MTDAPRSYPLHWPSGRPRTIDYLRKDGRFRRGSCPISISEACLRVEEEVERLGGVYLVISTNVEATLSGRPRSGQRIPADPGVCVYFHLKRQPYALACDGYREVAQNLAAIAAHIEATRAITRYGVATTEESLRAFQALPSADWPAVLGVERIGATKDAVNAAFRRLAAERHPDKPGGSHDEMARLTRAREEALKEVGA